MDPLSITASIIAIATLTIQVGEGFQRLRDTCHELPGKVHALSNEVNDLEVVLQQLVSVFRDRQTLEDEQQSAIRSLISQARELLQGMSAVIDKLLNTCSNKPYVYRAAVWRRLNPKLVSLQDEIRTIKSSLNVLIGASNSRDMMRVRVELQSLSTVSTRSSEHEVTFRDSFSDTLALHEKQMTGSFREGFDQVDRRISRVEDMLQSQVIQIEENYLKHLGVMYGRTRSPSSSRSSSPTSANSLQHRRASSPLVGVRVRQSTGMLCFSGCPCSCHAVKRSTSSGVFDRLLGQLFVGYSGIPYVSSRCDTELCRRQQAPSMDAEYWFPMGYFWSQIVKVQLQYQPNFGPQMSLRTFRRVPDNATAITYALEGDIERLKFLFDAGLASPRDISSTRGYSLLRWALYGQKYEACRFLLQAGADPYYSPVSRSDECPSDKASDILLRGGCSQRVTETLRAIADGNNFIENQNFRKIHKVVLGLSFSDLQDSIIEEEEGADVPDALGRTALEWAAARGDDRAVTTLLSYGANPNSMDKKLNTPLTLASNQNHAVCVRLLLEAGAEPDPPLPNGVKFGSPLNCAARNAKDPLVLKTLLDFNANVEAMGVDGVTPLLHVARNKGARHAIILLEHGANINATAADGRTPLTTAIMYNNHDVLRLLLDRWRDYSECPRLQGPHLLDLVVQYADVQTIKILTDAKHLSLKSDDTYALERFSEGVRNRPGVSDETTSAFDSLLDTLRRAAPALSRRCTDHSVEGIVANDESDDEMFQDAEEKIDTDIDDIVSLISSIKKCRTW